MTDPQLRFDLQRTASNAAVERVLYVLRQCLPRGSLECMYRKITNARFERDRAVADLVLFDGSTATCVVSTGSEIWMRWENATAMWVWCERWRKWRRYTEIEKSKLQCAEAVAQDQKG